jgi:hypothetical protein
MRHDAGTDSTWPFLMPAALSRSGRDMVSSLMENQDQALQAAPYLRHAQREVRLWVALNAARLVQSSTGDHYNPVKEREKRLVAPYLLVEWDVHECIPPTGGFEPWPMVTQSWPKC